MTTTTTEQAPDDIKKIEQRAYSRGYAVGRKRQKMERSAEQRARERQAFLDKAFFAALTACVTAQGWTAGEKPITNIRDRTKLAWDFAEEALRQRRYA